MACYAGETKTTPPLAEEWHDLETPWDSVAGRSPLCQLVRMANNRRAAMEVPTLTFPVVGSDPDDEFLGLRDYTSDPARNPAGEFEEVLATLINVVVAMVSANGQVNGSTGIRWHWVNADTVRADLTADLDGLVTTLQEDWQPIIEALRKALDALSGADIESEPWTPATVTFQVVSQFPSPTNIVQTTKEVSPDSIEHFTAPDPDIWVVDVSDSAQLYGDRADNGCGISHTFEERPSSGLWVEFSVSAAISPNDEEVWGEGNDFCSAGESPDVLFDDYRGGPVRMVGWLHRKSIRQTFEIEMIDSTQQKRNAVAQKLLDWSASTVADSIWGNPDGITGTAVPAGDSIVLRSDTIRYFIPIDFSLDEPVLPGSTPPTIDNIHLNVELLNPEFHFCIDGNGTWQDDN